jgi:NAD-dependent dihydropyrimidine dehydrogenase PreA subunit
MPTLRRIVQIDEEKCNGCGLCVPSCHEGAIQVIDGKARLVSDVYCDGLGNCLGECPEGAITIIEREAEPFDVEAVKQHLGVGKERASEQPAACPSVGFGGCPGSRAQVLRETAPVAVGEADAMPSELANWPVQLRLLPVHAPYLQGAKLLITADCVPFAFPDFHRRFLAGKTLAIACPKLDDTDLYLHKLAQIFLENDIESIDVLHMEVPCCFGLVHLVREALKESGKSIPTTVTRIGIRGDAQETTTL